MLPSKVTHTAYHLGEIRLIIIRAPVTG
jgi:hypothetical protein